MICTSCTSWLPAITDHHRNFGILLPFFERNDPSISSQHKLESNKVNCNNLNWREPWNTTPAAVRLQAHHHYHHHCHQQHRLVFVIHVKLDIGKFHLIVETLSLFLFSWVNSVGFIKFSGGTDQWNQERKKEMNSDSFSQMASSWSWPINSPISYTAFFQGPPHRSFSDPAIHCVMHWLSSSAAPYLPNCREHIQNRASWTAA